MEPAARGKQGMGVENDAHEETSTVMAKMNGAERLEELEFLMSVGGHMDSIVSRVDFPTISAAVRFCQKHGRHDMARRIMVRAGHSDPYNERWENAWLLTAA